MSLSDDTYDRLFYGSDYNSCSSYGEYMDYESDKSEAIAEDILTPMKELDKLCKTPFFIREDESDRLSIDELKKIQHTIPKTLKGETLRAYHKHPFFHNLCMNKNVTLEMVQLTLSICPDLVKQDTVLRVGYAYPLHCVCKNGDCPDSVVKLVLESYPKALLHDCLIENGPHHGDIALDFCDQGNPLHYYLTRGCRGGSGNVNLAVVKMLVDAYPPKLSALLSFTQKLKLVPIQFLVTNHGIDNHLEIASYLLETEPETIYELDRRGRTLLHRACMNSKVDLALVQLLYNKMPEAMRVRDNDRGERNSWDTGDLAGKVPLHKLCDNNNMDEQTSMDILRFMLSSDPSSPEMRDIEGNLPIHEAARNMPFSFCKEVIDAYPESLKVANSEGWLPIHLASDRSTSRYLRREDPNGIIRYMLQLNPDLSKARGRHGWLPIHNAVFGTISSLQLLIQYDPAGLSELVRDGRPDNQLLPLHLTDNLETVKELYDAYPEAILVGEINEGKKNTLVFKQKQREYAIKAKDKTAMTTADEDGWLPLHHALKDKAPLGSIKLLLRGNKNALHTPVQKGAHPLHISCEYSSAKVVEFLLDKVDGMLNKCDKNGDSLLHYACRSANLGVIKYLIAEQSVPSVSEVNAANKLPLHLLLQCENKAVDRESPEFIDACWHLFRANPESIQSLA